jgi:hypothetical protein
MIRQLANLAKISQAAGPDRREVLLRQAEMIRRLCEETVAEKHDRSDVERRYREVLAVHAAADKADALKAAES